MHALAIPLDRRIYPRNSYYGVLHIQHAHDPTWYAVYGEDVSTGGFAFFSDAVLCEGDTLVVAACELDGVTTTATVRHVSGRGRGFIVGVEFDEPLPSDLAWRFGC